MLFVPIQLMSREERVARLGFVAWAIVASEVGFWVVIAAGLIVRYVLRRQRLGLFLLMLTPVIDLILLLLTSIDLSRGAVATQAHGLAAVYIGVSLTFGKRMIAWADLRFRRHILKEPVDIPKLYGMAYAIQQFKGFLLHIAAFLIGGGMLALLIYWVGDAERTKVLGDTLRLWGIVLGIDGIIAISNFIWPKKARSG